MKIVAITEEGREFTYLTRTAHRVSARSAERICTELNERGYNLRDGQKWHIYDIDKYDNSCLYADIAKFIIRNGYLYEELYSRNW